MRASEHVELLRLCIDCGHTRDRHPNGEACAHAAHTGDDQRPVRCACDRFSGGRLSPEGLRAERAQSMRPDAWKVPL